MDLGLRASGLGFGPRVQGFNLEHGTPMKERP